MLINKTTISICATFVSILNTSVECKGTDLSIKLCASYEAMSCMRSKHQRFFNDQQRVLAVRFSRRRRANTKPKGVIRPVTVIIKEPRKSVRSASRRSATERITLRIVKILALAACCYSVLFLRS